MTYKLDIKLKGNYIEVNLNGNGDLQDDFDNWKKITKFCRKHKTYNILGITEVSVNPFKVIDAFDAYKMFKEVGIDTRYRIAWFDKDPGVRKMDQFALTVMQNRAVCSECEVFSEIHKAKKWLLKEENKKD
jgi:hypothetical protein